MKAIKIDLPAHFETINIMPVADYHWADPNSNHDRIMQDIAYIRDTPNVYAILNGDLMNCAIKSSVSDCYSETLSPMQELKVCVDLFAPIADKILCVVGGNHEARHFKTNGIDITQLMCNQLGIADRYSPTTALLFVRFGTTNGKTHNRPMAYTIYVSHGTGSGGRKEGGKIQRLVDLSTIVDADVYVCGHTHLPATLKDGFARPCMANSSVSFATRLYVNTSAKLDYGGYGETFGFKVPCLDTPVIHLNGKRKEANVTL